MACQNGSDVEIEMTGSKIETTDPKIEFTNSKLGITDPEFDFVIPNSESVVSFLLDPRVSEDQGCHSDECAPGDSD